MKSAIFALLLLGFAQFAAAEDSVTCDQGVSVAWTDDSKINVSGLYAHEQLRSLEILQKGDVDYVRIQNDKTVVRNSPLLKVKLTIDNGTSVRIVMIYDWDQFEDGGDVPVETLLQYPNGDLVSQKKTVCHAAQS